MLHVWFRNRGNVVIAFLVSRQSGSCTAGKEKTFQLAGNKVYWAHDATSQRAWRCVGRTRLETAAVLPPTRFSNTGLGGVSSSGHRIR
jgi:hypothetical protein